MGRLAGHQPPAQQSQGAGQDQKQDRRAFLLILEDIPNAVLRLPGRAGQGSGEGGAGEGAEQSALRDMKTPLLEIGVRR